MPSELITPHKYFPYANLPSFLRLYSSFFMGSNPLFVLIISLSRMACRLRQDDYSLLPSRNAAFYLACLLIDPPVTSSSVFIPAVSWHKGIGHKAFAPLHPLASKSFHSCSEGSWKPPQDAFLRDSPLFFTYPTLFNDMADFRIQHQKVKTISSPPKHSAANSLPGWPLISFSFCQARALPVLRRAKNKRRPSFERNEIFPSPPQTPFDTSPLRLTLPRETLPPVA